MKNISLNQFVFCDENNKTGQAYAKLNCKHWNLKSNDNNTCKQYCSLKNIDTHIRNCHMCKEREEIVPTQYSHYNNVAEEMRNKLPQFNFFNMSNQQNNTEFKDQVKLYASAEGSQLLQGKVSQEIFDKRKEQCMGCEKRKNVNSEVDKIGWCGGCGCSTSNPRAGLSQKLWMPTLSCPLKKFGPEKGEGFNIEDAKDVIGGVMKSVTDFLKLTD
jgi:hypothetical protein